MSKIILIDDFPQNNGGSEFVNRTVAEKLSIRQVESRSVILDPTVKYIVANISTMHPDVVKQLSQHPFYVILEHDYKFVHSRHPWRYPESIVPRNELINLDLYKNAKQIFVQTADHLSVFKANDIEGSFFNLECSIWGEELDILSQLEKTAPIVSTRMAILNSDNWIKGKNQAINFCEINGLDYEFVGHPNLHTFYEHLASHATLVFLPVARESCCRLILEARCLGLNVITPRNYGAAKESYFRLQGQELIDFLKEKSIRNIEKLKEILDVD